MKIAMKDDFIHVDGRSVMLQYKKNTLYLTAGSLSKFCLGVEYFDRLLNHTFIQWKKSELLLHFYLILKILWQFWGPGSLEGTQCNHSHLFSRPLVLSWCLHAVDPSAKNFRSFPCFPNMGQWQRSSMWLNCQNKAVPKTELWYCI